MCQGGICSPESTGGPTTGDTAGADSANDALESPVRRVSRHRHVAAGRRAIVGPAVRADAEVAHGALVVKVAGVRRALEVARAGAALTTGSWRTAARPRDGVVAHGRAAA